MAEDSVLKGEIIGLVCGATTNNFLVAVSGQENLMAKLTWDKGISFTLLSCPKNINKERVKNWNIIQLKNISYRYIQNAILK